MADVLNNPIRVPLAVAVNREAVPLAVAANREAVPFGLAVKIVAGNVPEYTGETVVIPSSQEQPLYTANKVVRDNITVKEIPFYETSNPGGGYTAIIG